MMFAALPLVLAQVTALEFDDVCSFGSDACHQPVARYEADAQGLFQRAVVARSWGSEVEVEVEELLLSQPPGFQDAASGSAIEAVRAGVRALGGTCGQDVTALTGAGGRCPAECPLVARDLSSETTGGEHYCTFSCVPATEAACVAYSPGEPIPDEKLGVCRACAIQGCNECVVPSGTMSLIEINRCGVCSAGYTLLPDGTCESTYGYLWDSLFTIIGILILGIVAWLCDLMVRPVINHEGLERGLATRSRAKLHTPKRLHTSSFRRLSTPDDVTPRCVTPRASFLASALGSGRKLWPLATNLCTTMVAGPGLTLHFNYIAMIILWSVGILVSWVAFAFYTDGSLFELGVRGAKTPAETCAVIAWGHEAQQRLMWAKVCFVGGCYIWSVGLFMVFSVRQLRVFRTLNEQETTHMDFCCILEGLPCLSGDEKIEEALCSEIERSTGQKPVGVSVAWEMEAVHDDLMGMIDESLDELHDDDHWDTGTDGGSMRVATIQRQTSQELGEKQEKDGPGARKGEACLTKLNRTFSATAQRTKNLISSRAGRRHSQMRTPRMEEPNRFRRMLLTFERAFLSQAVQTLLTRGRRRRALDEIDNEREAIDVEEELRAMHTSSTCFAVFDTVAARDAAVAKATKTGGVCFRNSVLAVSEARNEPEGVNWTNIRDEHIGWICLRICLGMTTIFCALVAWTLFLYLPYAFYFMSFNYAHGQSPGILEQATFVLIIVCGNASMYVMCGEVANRCGFRYNGDRELCYLLLYVSSCTLNVLLDLVCAYKVAFMALVGVGSRTQDGILLADLLSFTDRFESYPMQRDLGWTVFAYSFPCTFLIPFIAQPFFTIYLPYKIMASIVGYRPDIMGSRADVFLQAMPFDLSRYGDIALNVVLCSLVFWFPSGLTLFMFVGFTLSHVYVFFADQYRVLRASPAFNFSNMNTDWVAQAMLSVPCGMMWACTHYKANCLEGFRRFHVGSDEGLFGYCKESEALVAKCAAVFAFHVVLHLFMLRFVVPLCAAQAKTAPKTSYSECARRLAHSWFSVNPVHCLRSEYIYEHEPPWVFARRGKEHLLPQNTEIGAYFCDRSVETEDYSTSVHVVKTLSHNMTSLRNPRERPGPGQLDSTDLAHDPEKPVFISPRRSPSGLKTSSPKDDPKEEDEFSLRSGSSSSSSDECEVEG